MPQLIASVEGAEAKHVYPLKDRTTLGRRPYNDIVFDSMLVSGEHCVFELRGLADVTIEDLGSTNGTYINGHMIKSRYLLQDKDIITIGNFGIQFLASSTDEQPDTREPTNLMSLDALGLPGTSGALQARLQMLSGSSAGLEVPLVKAVTTFGQPGVAVVSISHRRDGYYVAHMDGSTSPTLNGQRLGAEAVLLAHHDVLNLAGTEMKFFLKGR
ncbi:FHA domain-containing protein [Polaromonas jejuensis]|uniref:FHA domain-containing protein n=1 Tax=Polaromonas jejuensis TaxID=457502 RepID=A0ABW0QCT1_9BURK|nr:FHA domain-containing protein [Polaromonas jejuensis]